MNEQDGSYNVNNNYYNCGLDKRRKLDAASYNKNILGKNKQAQNCEKPPLNFYPSTFQNKKVCNYVKKPDYFTPVTQASPYRYYYYQNSPFSRLTNHYKQSPNGNSLL
jgi:hypothetical protein